MPRPLAHRRAGRPVACTPRTASQLGRQVTVTVFPPLSEGRTRDGFDEAAATAQRLGAHPERAHHPRLGACRRRPPVDRHRPAAGRVGRPAAHARRTARRSSGRSGRGRCSPGPSRPPTGPASSTATSSPARLVLGTQGEPLLAETGLAAFAEFPGLGGAQQTRSATTPRPRCSSAPAVTAASDVYSLATTVYAAARGPRPAPEARRGHRHQRLAAAAHPAARRCPASAVRTCRRALDDALGGPLAAQPRKRPQQALEVASLLQDAAAPLRPWR